VTVLREEGYGPAESSVSGKAILDPLTGKQMASAPTSDIEAALGSGLIRKWKGAMSQLSGVADLRNWLAIGGEDILRNHPNPMVNELADSLREYFDAKARLSGKLMKDLNAIKDRFKGRFTGEEDTKLSKKRKAARAAGTALTLGGIKYKTQKTEFAKGEEEFAEYIGIREVGYKNQTERDAALAAAEAHYNNNMSEAGKAIVDWAQATSEMTGRLNEALDVHVKDPKMGKWRPIGNLGKFHYPRMLTAKTQQLLRVWQDKDGEWKPEYGQLLQDIVDNGNAVDIDDAHAKMRKDVEDMTGGGYLAGLELARGMKLPDLNSETGESYYDQSVQGYVKFISQYTDRAAQIHAFGQDRDGRVETAWSKVQKGVGTDEQIKQDIIRLQDAVESRHHKQGVVDLMVGAAGGLLLGSPLGSARNLATAYWTTAETFGWMRTTIGGWEQAEGGGRELKAGAIPLVLHSYLKAFAQTAKNIKAGDWRFQTPDVVADAMASGALQSDIMNAMILDLQDDSVWADESTWSTKLRNFNAKALFLHNAAERMGRALNYVSALQWMRASSGLIRSETGSWKTRLTVLKRLGFEGAEVDLLLTGNEAALERFGRAAVREKQYSYDASQTPLLFHGKNSSLGKAMFQFQRWGFQRLRDFARNVVMPLAYGTEIIHKGKKMRVREVWPMVRFLLLSVAAGELYGLLRLWLKDKERTEGSFGMIAATYEQEPSRGFWMGMERLGMDMVMSGHLGVVSDYSMLTRDVATRGPRWRSPLEPPSFHIATDVIGLVTKRWQRGAWIEGLGDDLLDLFNTFPTFQQTKVFGTRLIGLKPGEDFDFVKEQRARKQVQVMRNYARDFAGEYDLQFSTGGGDAVNPNTTEYRAIREALQIGDAAEAARIKKVMLEGLRGEERRKMLSAIRGSVRGNQPLDAFGVTSDKKKKEFKRWLVKRRGKAKAAELMDIQNRYLRSAKRAGLN
jgi:hypothetical protein